MEIFERLYFFLFNALTDALEAIDSGLIAEAAEALRDAQCTAEELYIQRADWQKADDEEMQEIEKMTEDFFKSADCKLLRAMLEETESK